MRLEFRLESPDLGLAERDAVGRVTVVLGEVLAGKVEPFLGRPEPLDDCDTTEGLPEVPEGKVTDLSLEFMSISNL